MPMGRREKLVDQLLQHCLNALILGGTYALLGIGLTLIFGIMRVVNFTHGELYAFGAYMMYMWVMVLGANFYLALPLAVLLGVVLGAAIEIVLLRRLRGADIDTTMLVMIGAWIALQNTEQLVWTRRGQVDRHAVPVLAAGARPRLGVLEPAVRVRGRARADRRLLRADQPHQARQGHARHLPGPRDGGADGRADQHHPHGHLRARLGPRRRGRRAARARCSSSTRPWAISPR